MSDTVVRARNSVLVPYIMNYIGDATTQSAKDLATNIGNAITSFVTVNTPGIDIPLSGVAVDFETNKAEIQAILIANPIWKDTVTAATGQIIIEMVATALTYMQYNIVRCTEETMIGTARIPSSIYANTRMLGVRINRKIPAQSLSTIKRSGDLTNSLAIEAYQQFNVSSSNGNGVSLFNRYPILFPSGSDTVVSNLFEGQVSSPAGFISTGLPYQSFILGNSNYAISDVDVTVIVNGVKWARAEYAEYFSLGLWEYNSDSLVYTDESTADGNVEIRFGNGTYGKIPPTGSQIIIQYVTTSGAQGNVNLIGSTLSANFSNLVSGTVNTQNQNGNDALEATEYQTLSPGIFSSKFRASTGSDNNALARRYPGVIDAIVQGQRDIAPDDLRQMLIARCTLITNTVWTDANFADFKTWFENLSIGNVRIYRNIPTPITLNITATIYCFNSTSLSLLQQQIKDRLQDAFKIRSGVLGYKRAVSDIDDIIKRTDRTEIDYYDIITPTQDITVNADQYVVLGNIVLNMAYTTRQRT